MADDSPDTVRFLPVGLDVRDRNCLVVGGGSVGTRKVLTLVGAGANVTVVSPAASRELALKVDSGQVRWVKDSFREDHLDDVFLAIAATDDESLNAEIVRLAAVGGVLVCDASSSERSQVIFGALLKTDEATIAVFTDGRDPGRARRTRDWIADRMSRD